VIRTSRILSTSNYDNESPLLQASLNKSFSYLQQLENETQNNKSENSLSHNALDYSFYVDERSKSDVKIFT